MIVVPEWVKSHSDKGEKILRDILPLSSLISQTFMNISKVQGSKILLMMEED